MNVGRTELVAPARFRAAMSRMAHSVTVVTTRTTGVEVRGLTCSAFMSVSADPPIIAVGVHAASGTLCAIKETGAFCVNVLHRNEEPVALAFASQIEDRFSAVSWRASSCTGAPILDRSCVAYFDCDLVETAPVGDHVLVLGHVRDAVVLNDTESPLVHCQRTFGLWTQPNVNPTIPPTEIVE